MKAYSMDLRERVLHDVDAGLKTGLIADWTSPRKTGAQLRMFGTFELRRGDVPQR